MESKSHPDTADRPAFEPPRARRSRISRNRVLTVVAIILALFALLRIIALFG